MQVLQTAIFTQDTMPILIGIRELPVHKLVLICKKSDISAAFDFSASIGRALGIDVDHETIEKDIFQEMMNTVSTLVTSESNRYEVFVNVTSSEQMLTCAAISAAFVTGAKAFYINKDTPIMLPVIKLSYERVISDAKLAILRTLIKDDGVPMSLSELSTKSELDKSLVSYHIRGGRDTRGLEELGLVAIDRGKQGRVEIAPTMLGKLLASAKI